MQNKLVFLAVLTSFGLVLDRFFEKPVATTLDRSLSGPGTIPRLPKAVQSGFLPKKAKKVDWTGLLNSMSECEQEVVESVVMAGHTSRVLKMVEMIADVNGMALLGREPVERAYGVNKGDEMECRDLWLQQTNLHDEECCQHNINA